MGEEILAADGTPKQFEGNEGNDIVATEMGKELDEPTKAGSMDSSNGANGNAKEADKLGSFNVPKDAVDEWPVPKQIHTFYFIRVRSYEDPQLKAKIEQADKDLQRKNQARYQIIESLKAKRSERSNLKSELQPFLAENKKYRETMEEKKKEMQPLQEDLRKYRTANSAVRERGMGLCSSEEELNDLIKSLHYRIQHESNTLNEEKKLLKEIKQLEATRDKVIATAAMKVEIEGSKDRKTAIQDRVKLLGVNMDDVRKEKQAVMANIRQLDEELKIIDNEIESLEEELRSVTERRDKAYETLASLRKTRDEANACFYQNRSLLNNARELAAKKDVSGLGALSNTEAEKFMSQWNTDKTFRDDYERRTLTSLDNRQLSRDGRMRNPDEKPIVAATPPATTAETEPLKITPKQGKETTKPSPPEADTTRGEDLVVKSTKASVEDDTEEIGKSREASKPREMDPAKAKEMKREEEIAKAKAAMERKKKLAEKAAAKAASRAQKEAEKKLKEKEKKAKKKSGAAEVAAPAEQTETEDGAAEPEEADVKMEEKKVPEARKEPPKATARNRKLPQQPKMKNQLPRAVLKKKKSQSHLYWAVPAAVLSVLAIVVLGYYTLGKSLRA